MRWRTETGTGIQGPLADVVAMLEKGEDPLTRDWPECQLTLIFNGPWIALQGKACPPKGNHGLQPHEWAKFMRGQKTHTLARMRLPEGVTHRTLLEGLWAGTLEINRCVS